MVIRKTILFCLMVVLVLSISMITFTTGIDNNITPTAAANLIDLREMTLNDSVDLSEYIGIENMGDEVEYVIESFIETYINASMTDFEKEMQIIKYLVATVDYDFENAKNNTVPFVSYTAHGALINKKAVCAGYANAFNALAHAVGLQTETVSGYATGEGSHAWNRILLDGEWYNVDVTFEDPVTTNGLNNGFGFNLLSNSYINRTDAEFRVDHTWSGGQAANGTIYGPTKVRYYMLTGKIDGNISNDDYRKVLFKNTFPIVKHVGNEYSVSFTLDKVLNSLGTKLDDESNFLNTLDMTKLLTYIQTELALGNNIIYITYTANVDLNFINDAWLRQNFGHQYWGVFKLKTDDVNSNYTFNQVFNTIVIVPDVLNYEK